MRRFDKEMHRKYPEMFRVDEPGDNGAYCIAEKAFLVQYNPGIVICDQVERDGSLTDVSDDHPEITEPYLVHLCDGDIEKAKRILKEHVGIPLVID